MNKTLLKILPTALVISIIVPQVAFAAWWNPLTWNVWSIFQTAPKVQIFTATTTQTTSTTSLSAKAGSVHTSVASTSSKVSKKTGGSTSSMTQPQQQASQSSSATIACGGVAWSLKSICNQGYEPRCTAGTSVTCYPIGTAADQVGQNITQQQETATPVQSQAPIVSSQQLQNGLAEFYAQFSISSVESGIPQLLSILSDEQTVANSSAQLNASCISTYNSQVAYFQKQGQNALSNAITASKGLIVSGAMANIKAQTQMQLDNLKTIEDSCLASHPVGSSVSGQISQITSQLNQLQSQVQANPTSLSDIASILQNYNSLQGQVFAINSSMQTPMSMPSQVPSSGFFSCSSQGGYYNCNGSGVSMSCSSVTANSLNCSSTNGQNISCTTQGGYVNCSY